MARCADAGTALRAPRALPVPVPHLLVAVVAVLWLAPGGLADRLLGGLPIDLVRDRFGAGIILVYVYKETPFLVLLMLTAMGRRSRSERRPRQCWAPRAASALRLGDLADGPRPAGAWARSSSRRSRSARSRSRCPSGRTIRSRSPTYALQATQGDLIAGEGIAAAALLVAAPSPIVLALSRVRPRPGRVEGD